MPYFILPHIPGTPKSFYGILGIFIKNAKLTLFLILIGVEMGKNKIQKAV